MPPSCFSAYLCAMIVCGGTRMCILTPIPVLGSRWLLVCHVQRTTHGRRILHSAYDYYPVSHDQPPDQTVLSPGRMTPASGTTCAMFNYLMIPTQLMPRSMSLEKLPDCRMTSLFTSIHQLFRRAQHALIHVYVSKLPRTTQCKFYIHYVYQMYC